MPDLTANSAPTGEITVLFFGSLALKRGQRKLTVAAEAELTLRQLVSQLGGAQWHSFLLAVNQEQTNDLDRLLHANDEVAMMPPFSGG
ncbi:MAG: MoaD/ThiS family protein [Mariprofundales bacterium]|nr:MoaD/ThiS family protein [Mariprofundales bacterium]